MLKTKIMIQYKYGEDGELILPEKRNTFLTVLCILTFIGSGWGLISSGIAYYTAGRTVEMLQDSSGMLNQNKDAVNFDTLKTGSDRSFDTLKNTKSENHQQEVGKNIEKRMQHSLQTMLTKKNIQDKALGDMVSSLFTLLGAILMFFLNRKGFYLYILGVAISVAVPFYLYGNDFLAVGMSMIGPFFGLVFIALYALNLSQMKK